MNTAEQKSPRVSFSTNKAKQIYLAILFFIAAIFLIALFIYQQQISQEDTQMSQDDITSQNNSVTPTEPVPVTPVANNLNKYAGSNFSITVPSQLKITRNTDCGEMDNEGLQIALPISISNKSKQDTNTITVCVEKSDTASGSLQTYTDLKMSLQENLTKRLIDSLTEQTIANHNTLVYDFTRKDFPGNYEKTIYIPESSVAYRITWSIHAQDTMSMEAIKTASQTQINQIIASLLLKT